MIFLLQYWKLVAIAGLGALLGLQTYRLQGTQKDFNLYRLEQETQERERSIEYAREKSFNAWNKKVTDEDYRNDLTVARAASLRVAGDIAETIAASGVTGSGSQPTVCFESVKLAAEIAGFMGRLAGRLAGVAAEGESVAAAYRSCAEWARGLGALRPESAPSSPPGGDGVDAASAALYR